MKYCYLVIIGMLSGCSTAKFYSNADTYVQKKAEKIIRNSVVKRYTYNEVWKLGATQLGYVDTSFCQMDFRDRQPSKEALISDLAVQAQKLGGNALVFDACAVNRSTASCHSYIQCNGVAYLVN